MVDLDAVLALGERTHELLLREVNELVLEGVERSGGDGRERRHEILLCDRRVRRARGGAHLPRALPVNNARKDPLLKGVNSPTERTAPLYRTTPQRAQ